MTLSLHFCWRRWGFSLPGLRTRDHPLGPPSTLAEIFRHKCLQSTLQTSPPTPRSHIRSFGTLGKLLKTPLTPQIYDSAGGMGGPRIIFLVAILLFLLVRSPCKIWEPYNKPIWGFSYGMKRERRLIPFTSLLFRLAPHEHERKFSGTRVCRVTFKQFPQPLRSHIRSFGTLGQHLKIPPPDPPNI